MVFSLFNYIYPGTHLDSTGHVDTRIWFAIPFFMDDVKRQVICLKFPYGAQEEEFSEEEIPY